MRLARWILVLGASLWLGASCGTSPEPATSANGGGGGGTLCPTDAIVDTTPPPDPGTPEPPPRADCGSPAFAQPSTLRRYPYLQSVTTTSARIAWTATGDAAGTVRFATTSAGPWTEVVATAEAFTTTRTGDSEAYTALDATLENLEPNRAYCYEVLVDGAPVATGLTFQTAWQGAERPIRILAFGDSGNASPEQLAVRDAFMQREFDLFLHLGDMAYGEGTFVQFEERVFGVYRDFMHRVPSFPTIGNHEYNTDNGQPYLDVYYLFEQALRETDQERYYSFDYGNVHFVSLDSNDEMLLPIQLDLDEAIDDDMIDWLRTDLSRSDATWKIAFFHHPPFSLYADRGDNAGVLNQIIPALREGEVDLILVGHDHHYVRSLPIRGDCPVPGGEGAIPFIIVGSGGAGLTTFADEDDWYVAAKDDTVHAFLSLTVHGCSGRGEAIDIQGRTIDSFELNGCR